MPTMGMNRLPAIASVSGLTMRAVALMTRRAAGPKLIRFLYLI
jgi:hypothetical protein